VSPPPSPAPPTPGVVNNCPNGICISGGTVTGPTVNNFGPPEAKVHWQVDSTAQHKPNTTVIVFSLDHSMEIPAFFARCDRPCWTSEDSKVEGIGQTAHFSTRADASMAGLSLLIPRPLGPGIKVYWHVFATDQSPEILGIDPIPGDLAAKLPH
jgi:hypothetical protein